MAGSPGTELHEKLSDVIECSICAEIFTNPKLLPCVHTFCLHCLEKYGKDKSPGDMMACPLCRNEFVFPQQGFSNLPSNFFIGKIVEIGKLATVPAKEEVCELCSEETAVAKMVCIDCEQKLCDRCSKSHTKIKHFQNHQIVEIGSQLNVKELNFRDSYCEHHPKELIKMYCHEDNLAICLICCVESHQSHRCSNVGKAAEQIAEQLKDDIRKVANMRPECDEIFQKLEKYKKEFSEEVFKTEENIRKSGADLKKLIDQNMEELVQNLRVVRDRNVKCFETTKQDVDRFRVMIDSYQRYCNELLTRGSSVDICRDGRQMHSRAIDLGKQPANCSVDDFYCEKIAFHCTNAEVLMKHNRTKNVVGELTVTKSSDRIVKFQKGISDIQAYWEKMKIDEDLKTVQLNASEQEYKDVAKAVLSTSQSTVNQIVKIERIQNKLLYQQYVLRKAAMDAANPEVQNEMTLWHGTSANTVTVENINQHGFHRSYCGKPIAYGRGVYFAKNFSFATQNTYAPPDANGYKQVYQCKVLTGEYAVGNENMIVPPYKPESTSIRYTSTVDNVNTPTMFVIYHDSQAYPEYLIYFK